MTHFSDYFTSLYAIERVVSKHQTATLFENNNGKWSVIQHLYHCWMVEKGVLAYIKLKTQNPTSLVSVSIKTRLMFRFFFIALRWNVLKVNAPEIVQDFPNKMSIKDLMEKWTMTRKDADNFFINFPKNLADKGIFRHAFIGRLNKKLTQKFIEQHLRHHLKLCDLQPN